MRRWSGDWAEVAGRVERWLLPAECLLCRERVGLGPDDPLVCQLCRARWRRLPAPRCPRCGQPVDRDTECRICAGWPAGFGGVESAVWLDPMARRAVHLLKYDGWRRIADALAAAMAGLAPLDDRPALTAIPLASARLKARGYNQSAELARGVARRRGLVVRDCLRRTRETTTQTALTPEEREANLRGAFVAVNPPPVVVLVDDVFTTGATLVAAARALLAGGARRVSAVTFGRAELPLAAISRRV